MKPIQLSELVRPWQHELVAFSHLCASNTHRLLVDSGGTPRRENNSLGGLEERGGLLVLFSCTFFFNTSHSRVEGGATAVLCYNIQSGPEAPS